MGTAATTGGATNVSCLIKQAVVLSFVFVPILVAIQILLSDQGSLPDQFADSAFDNTLYSANYKEPFRSYPCTPRKVHISQANDVSDKLVSITVSFTLNQLNCSDVHPKIVYGRSYRVEGTVIKFERLNFTFRSPTTGEDYHSDWIFHMELSNLVAGLEEYWYRIQIDRDLSVTSMFNNQSYLRRYFLRGRERRIGETPTYQLRTPPLPGSPTSLALVGDIGQTENSTKTMNHILRAANAPVPHPVSALLIAGDLSYADGDPHRWESWLNLMVR